MKKILFAFLALIGIMTSCTNDDIEIHSYQTFTYNVSTQPAYDTFYATTTLKNRFLSGERGDYCLGIYTYIYDNNGNLVNEEFTTSKTFGLVSHDFKLEYGKYTAVTVEMIVDRDDHNLSEAFEMRNTDKLSTIEVGYRKKTNSDGTTGYVTYSLWYESVGVSTQEIIVDANTKNINVTPKAIGCVIDSRFYNFNKCNDKNLLVIATKNCPIGRRLDPTLQGNDRFVYEKYNSGNNAELRWTRYSSTNSFSEEELADVYLLEEGNDLECGIGAGNFTKGKGSSWYSAKRNVLSDGKIYYAGLYYVGGATSSGLDGGIFATQSEFDSWYNKAKNMYVTDSPTTTFSLMNPNTNWKSSVSAVQSSMSGYTMVIGSNGKAEQLASGTYAIAYNGKGSENLIAYFFDSMTTGLNEVNVFYDKSTTKQADIKSALDLKYTFLAEESGKFMYVDSSVSTVVLLSDTDEDYVVGYVDADVVFSSPSYKSFAQNRTKMLKSSLIKPTVKNENFSKIVIPFKSSKSEKRMTIMK